jgi:hypothetical protein
MYSKKEINLRDEITRMSNQMQSNVNQPRIGTTTIRFGFVKQPSTAKSKDITPVSTKMNSKYLANNAVEFRVLSISKIFSLERSGTSTNQGVYVAPIVVVFAIPKEEASYVLSALQVNRNQIVNAAVIADKSQEFSSSNAGRNGKSQAETTIMSFSEVQMEERDEYFYVAIRANRTETEFVAESATGQTDGRIVFGFCSTQFGDSK